MRRPEDKRIPICAPPKDNKIKQKQKGPNAKEEQREGKSENEVTESFISTFSLFSLRETRAGTLDRPKSLRIKSCVCA